MEVKPFGDPEDDDVVDPVPAPGPEPVPRSAPEAPQPMTEPAPTTSVIQAISRRNWTRFLLWFGVGLIGLTALGFGAVTLGEWLAG